MQHKILTAAAAALLATCLSAQNRLMHSIGAPVPGLKTTVRLTHPASSNGNTFALVVSPHTDKTTTFPTATGIKGTFRLDANLFTILLFGKLAASGTTTDLSFPVPNSSSLLGLMADLQWADDTGSAIELSDNELVATVISGVGTSVLAEGSTGTTIGFKWENVKNASLGNETVINTTENWDREAMRGGGTRGYGEGYFGGNGFTDFNSGPYIFKLDRPQRDMQDGTIGGYATQNGNRVRVMRNTKKTNEFFLITIEDQTGKVAKVSGSVLLNASTTSTSNPYGDYWFIYPDGKLLCGVGDFAAGGDKMVIARLDGQTWKAATGSTQPGNNTSTLLLPVPANVALFDQNTMIGNGVLLQGGHNSTDNTKRSIYWAPLDGSAAPKEVPLPKLGNGKDPRFIPSSVFRATKDMKTIVFHAYTSSTVDGDVYAVTNMSRTGITLKNISGFKKDTRQEFWSDERSAESTFTCNLSPDGKWVAFVTGAGGTAAPNVLYAAPTDGSKAGTLVPISGFPTTTTWMGMVHFLPPAGGRYPMICWAGNGSATGDLFLVSDVAAASPTVTNLTKKGNLDLNWSYESNNGLFLTIGRNHGGTNPAPDLNIIAVGPTGNLIDVTGGEFASGKAPAQELSPTMYINEFRMAPNTSNEMYFVGRPVRKVSGSTTTYFDANIYKFNLEAPGAAVQVTNYTGSATALTGVIHIESIVPLSDGSVVYAASTGTAATTAGRKQTVRWHKGDGKGTDVNLGEFAEGAYVSNGSINVVEKSGAVYWVQANSTTTTNNIGYFALLNNTMKGHPLSLTGLPVTGTSGYIVNVANSDAK